MAPNVKGVRPAFSSSHAPVIILIVALFAVTLTFVGNDFQAAKSAPNSDQRGIVGERADDATVQVSGGEVRAISQVGEKIVVGGTFTHVGPARRGAMAPIDLLSGDFVSAFPDIDGAVFAVESDGVGGHWVGGNFASVGGQAVQHLVHLLADGSIDSTFSAAVNGPVRTIVRSSTSLAIGGDFTTVNGAPSPRVAMLTTTGTTIWNGAANATVSSLEFSTDGGRLFIGGDFTSYGGNATFKRLVAVQAVDGATDLAFVPGTVNLRVRGMAATPSGLWIAGDFNRVNGATRNRLALLDVASGALNPLSPSFNGSVHAVSLDPVSGTLYAVGAFARLGTSNFPGFVGLDPTTATAVTPPLAIVGSVSTIVLDGAGSAYIGGDFVGLPEKSMPRHVAKMTLADGSLTAIVPPTSTPLALARAPKESFGIRALTLSGTTLTVAGDFSDYGTIARPYLVAWDRTTKALEVGFDGQLNNAVRALDASPDGTSVYVGGDFSQSHGLSASSFAKLSMTNGQPVGGFSVTFDSYVKEIVAHPDGQRVFVGGNFRFTNGQNTERFAGIQASSGAVIPGYSIDFTEPTNDASEGGVRAMAINGAGTNLAVIGNFRKAEGLDRPLVALIDVADPNVATVSAWRTDLYTQPCTGGRIGWMRDVSYSVDASKLFVVSSGHFYYPACDAVNAFDATAAGTTAALWTARPGDTIETVAATSDAVYIGGHFRYLDWEYRNEPRFQVGALDPATGQPLAWDPSANGFRGILVMEAEPSGLYLGGDNTAVGQVPHGGLARFSWPADGLRLRRSASKTVLLAPGDTTDVTLSIDNPTAHSYDLATISDSLTGTVNGAGTCAMPATVPAMGTWSCTFSQAIAPAAAGTATKATTTVVGSWNAAPRTIIDSTGYIADTQYYPPIVRTVLAPISVPFPEGNSLISVTVMNESEQVPLQLNSLNSNLHGDLNGQGTCIAPQTIAAHRMYQCQYSGVFAGSIGTSATNTVTTNLTQNGTTFNKSHSSSVSLSRPADGGQILMVVKTIAPLSSADLKLRDRFVSLGFTVVLADDDTVQTTDAEGKALVYLSTTSLDSAIGTKFTTVAQPVMVGNQLLYDEMQMTTTQGLVTATGGTVVGPLHPLNSPTTGSQVLFSSARPMTWGTPSAAADVVLTVVTPGGVTPSEFVYQPGDALVDASPASGCRLGFPAEKTSIAKWNTTLMFPRFDRAVRLAVYGCGAGIISTVAGSAVAGSGPDGAIATTTGIADPYGVLADPSGGFYFVDKAGNRVRFVDANGVLSTVIGTGVSGSTGDGGPATSARLNSPARLRRDPQGRLVIIDAGNHRIRRVEANGIISTIAGNGSAGFLGDGGQATAARINSPQDVAWNGAGEMFIADRSNHRIRKVDINGVITTVAGLGGAGYNGDEIPATAAQLNNPYGVSVLADGTVLIADYDNNRVRSIDDVGLIHTAAGTGVPTASGDGGPAVLADLHKPICVTARPSGGFFICDYNNNRVRFVSTDGVITTAVAVGTAAFAGDGDLAIFSRGNRFADATVTAQGDLLVVDRFNRRIRIVIKGAI